LQNEGYRIVRFWNDEVLENLDGVHQTIAEKPSRITPPKPSPIMGEGLIIHSRPLDGGGPGWG
jgi:hypothetical protein